LQQRYSYQETEYKAEDEEAAAIVAAKNGVESYAFSLKQTLAESGDKFSAEDRTALQTKVDETIGLLENAGSGSKDEFESMQKDLESVAQVRSCDILCGAILIVLFFFLAYYDQVTWLASALITI
jgi:molecular chaperone DnaK (HSP70)